MAEDSNLSFEELYSRGLAQFRNAAAKQADLDRVLQVSALR